MMDRHRISAAACLLVALALGLAACVLSPGKFDSTLNLRKDGHFTFTYTGEIYLLALGQLAEAAKKAEAAEEFKPTECYDDNVDQRDCTAEEIAEQRSTWEAGKAERAKTAEREAASMRALLGGIDPADPKAAEELAERLRRQEGWKRVEYRGQGLFDVDFAIASQLGHDFVFPTLERFPMTNSFVLAHLRQGKQVRIEAPGFAAQAGGNPFQAMMSGFAGLSAPGDTPGEQPFVIPETEGTFRIVTDGKILANNTDEGPHAGPGGQVLEWHVTKRTEAAPTALIDLGG